MDQTGKFALQLLNTLQDDRIGLDVSNAFDLEVESRRDSIVVEGLALSRRLLNIGILRLRPSTTVNYLETNTLGARIPTTQPQHLSRTTSPDDGACYVDRIRSRWQK